MKNNRTKKKYNKSKYKNIKYKGGNKLLNDNYIINGLSEILNERPLKYKFGIKKHDNNYIVFIDSDINIIENNEDKYIDRECLNFYLKEGTQGVTIVISMLFKCAPIKNYGNFILNAIKEFAEKNGYYSVIINSDGSILPFTFMVNGQEKVIHIDLAHLTILSSGESWYNKMGFYSLKNREEIIENEHKINQEIGSIDDNIKIIELINNKIKTFESRKTRNPWKKLGIKMPICVEIIDSYGKFKDLYEFILEITKQSDTNTVTIKEVFAKITNYIRNNCDSINETCIIDYMTLQKIECFIDFVYELLDIKYTGTSLQYIVPRSVNSGGSRKKIKRRYKTKKRGRSL